MNGSMDVPRVRPLLDRRNQWVRRRGHGWKHRSRCSPNETGAGYKVVDTGPWIFGSKVLITAGAITDVDLVDEKAYLELSKEQIKNAPVYTPD